MKQPKMLVNFKVNTNSHVHICALLTIFATEALIGHAYETWRKADGSNGFNNINELFDWKHGIKMGIPLQECDDGIHGIEVDWDPRSTAETTCYMDDTINRHSLPVDIRSQSKSVTHVCLGESIHYDSALPLNGEHRPLWPVYGEYQYLPPQRWVHALEHGAIVLLYHPCMATTKALEDLKSIVRGCLRKHIISPYRLIPMHMPFVLLAFNHARLFSGYDDTINDLTMVTKFIRNHGLQAPEAHVVEDGQYSIGLKHRAKVVSDLQDSNICGDFLR